MSFSSFFKIKFTERLQKYEGHLFKPGMLNVNYGTMAQKHKINQVKWFAL